MEQRIENMQQEADVISSVTVNPLSFSGSETPTLVPGIVIQVRPDCICFS